MAFAEETIPEQEVHTFSFTGYSREGKREWEVQGTKASLEGDLARLEKPKLAMEGKTTMTVTSERGTYDRHTAQAHLEENVFAQTSDGATLKTDSLDWNGSSKKLSTEDRLTIERGTLMTEGKGAEAYPDLKKVALKEEVKVHMAPDIQITSRGPMELDYTHNIAVFHDEVRAIDKEGELLADRMDITFEPETNHVKELIATGNVRITRGDNVSYSDKAIYNALLGKVTLVGKPKLLIKPEEKEKRAFIRDQAPR
ncbi:MAG: LPS export ABC transporter periplasmic protein LptC [Candidatus Omnitrophica bacterium]|nr:LPS export ABC transporter periplasmic protein LptC [Candidatus Omnitrophota bacterium]